MSNLKYVCGHCGSSNIQVKAWVNLNNPQIETLDYLADDYQDYWCSSCETHPFIVTKEDYKKIKKEKNG